MIDEIKARWGDLLKKVPATELTNWDFPEDTVEFLTEIGMPLDANLAHNPIFMMEFVPSAMQEIIYEETRYLAIARLGYTKVAIQERSGKIFTLSNPEIPPSHHFMNGSIVKLLAFIVIRDTHQPLFEEITEQANAYAYNKENLSAEEVKEWWKLERKVDQLVFDVVDELKEVDPSAFDSYDNYWPTIFLLDPPRLEES